MGKPRNESIDDREFDQSCLRLKSHGLKLHRDYTAHFFRWSFARNFIRSGHKVIEVGCGIETPLVQVLSRMTVSPPVPKRYIGVELNKMRNKPKRHWARYLDEFDFTKRWKELPGRNDFVVHFEIIEHMKLVHGRKLLKGCFALLKRRGIMLMSTPVFNGKQANNHIHEYTVIELQKEVKRAGFIVEARYGTFMNITNFKKLATHHRQTLNELAGYYDHDALSCFIAPLYPDLARNNLWVCRRP